MKKGNFQRKQEGDFKFVMGFQTLSALYVDCVFVSQKIKNKKKEKETHIWWKSLLIGQGKSV